MRAAPAPTPIPPRPASSRTPAPPSAARSAGRPWAPPALQRLPWEEQGTEAPPLRLAQPFLQPRPPVPGPQIVQPREVRQQRPQRTPDPDGSWCVSKGRKEAISREGREGTAALIPRSGTYQTTQTRMRLRRKGRASGAPPAPSRLPSSSRSSREICSDRSSDAPVMKAPDRAPHPAPCTPSPAPFSQTPPAPSPSPPAPLPAVATRGRRPCLRASPAPRARPRQIAPVLAQQRQSELRIDLLHFRHHRSPSIPIGASAASSISVSSNCPCSRA